MIRDRFRQTETSRRLKEFLSLRSGGEKNIYPKMQDDSPKISVVIPSFNLGRFLERTLLSIIHQNYPKVEIIIIDGGSSDETLSIIKKYEKYIAYWISEKDQGQSHALNKGFEKASGDVFAWQNCDDIYLPHAFSQVAEVFQKHPEVGVCYGNWYSIDGQENVISRHLSLKPRIPHSPYENMDAYNQTIFWRKEVHERFGKFDENLHQKMDCDMIVRFLLNEGPAGFFQLESFLGAFRCYPEQKTSLSIDNKGFFSEETYMEKKFNFEASDSLKGKYYRLRYRFAQLYESLVDGGVFYALKKFENSYCRRGRFF